MEAEFLRGLPGDITRHRQRVRIRARNYSHLVATHILVVQVVKRRAQTPDTGYRGRHCAADVLTGLVGAQP